MKPTHAQKKENNICHHQTYPKRMIKGNSLNNSKMIKAGFLEHLSVRKNTVSKKYGQTQNQ